MNHNLGQTPQSGGPAAAPNQAAIPAPGTPGQVAPPASATFAPQAAAASQVPTAAQTPSPTPAGQAAPSAASAGQPAASQANQAPAAAPTGAAAPSTLGNVPAAPGAPAVPGSAAAPVGQYSRQKPPLLGTGLQRDILTLLIKIGGIVGAVAIIFFFVFGVLQYDSPQMYPAVRAGDLVMYSRLNQSYVAQDLVVLTFQGETQVRRVVAIAGNVVDVTEDGLLIDGALQQEPNIFTETHRYQTEITFPLTVPEGHVFVLGDHREGSTDSRTYGPVRADDTLGKVSGIFRRRGF
ncbi:MAG: signal peptidase I [Coriobacteriia bacterium]|nr:signal peptidase I [Coriobacteriia bacterium]